MLKHTDKQIVIGLGKTGLSCVRYLLSRGFSDICVCDTRERPPQTAIEALSALSPTIPLHTGTLLPELLSGADRIIVSPGVSVSHPAIQQAVAHGVPVVGDVELFALEVSVPVIAITGSNGKSTVTTLVGEMLRAQGIQAIEAGNIGLPVLDALEMQADVYVLELSSFQLETTHSLSPAAATVLNISEDHMDRYPNLKVYAEAKSKVYHQAEYAIYNFTDLLTQLNLPSKAESFSLQPTSPMIQWGYSNHHLVYGDKVLLDCAQMRIKGLHNIENAMVALALTNQVAGNYEKALTVLKTFEGLPHRCQWVGEKQGVTWINDSKATNVGATLAAIDGLGTQIDGKIVLLVGGDGKGADFSALVPAVSEYVKTVICYGRDGTALHQFLEPYSNAFLVDDLTQAVATAHQSAASGDVVLLSPACASLDMYANFEARGQHFIQLAGAYL